MLPSTHSRVTVLWQNSAHVYAETYVTLPPQFTRWHLQFPAQACRRAKLYKRAHNNPPTVSLASDFSLCVWDASIHTSDSVDLMNYKVSWYLGKFPFPAIEEAILQSCRRGLKFCSYSSVEVHAELSSYSFQEFDWQ